MNISKKITTELFSSKIDELDTLKNNPYLNVYQTLIEHIQKVSKIEDINSIISIAHMVYGWMPTILTCNFEELDIALWPKIKKGCMDREFLLNIKRLINNSIVGGSKFLHFINPIDYAIWDSKVYLSITNLKPSDYRVNNVDNYIQYNASLKKLVKSDWIETLKSRMMKLGFCDNNASNLRVLELILFYSEK